MRHSELISTASQQGQHKFFGPELSGEQSKAVVTPNQASVEPRAKLRLSDTAADAGHPFGH